MTRGGNKIEAKIANIQAQDLSHLDRKYFSTRVDTTAPSAIVGQCPTRSFGGGAGFNRSAKLHGYVYIVRCDERGRPKLSMHLSYLNFSETGQRYHSRLSNEPQNWNEEAGAFDTSRLDNCFFFHQPTSFFKH